jgi:hypothetical protein
MMTCMKFRRYQLGLLVSHPINAGARNMISEPLIRLLSAHRNRIISHRGTADSCRYETDVIRLAVHDPIK